MTWRGTWVALTDDGRSRVDGAFIDLLAEERDLLAVLPPEEQSDLAGEPAPPAAAVRVPDRLTPADLAPVPSNTASNEYMLSPVAEAARPVESDHEMV